MFQTHVMTIIKMTDSRIPPSIVPKYGGQAPFRALGNDVLRRLEFSYIIVPIRGGQAPFRAPGNGVLRTVEGTVEG